jgi:hypothetical protein
MIFFNDSKYFAQMAKACGRAAVLCLTLALTMIAAGGYLYALGSGWCVHAGAIALLSICLAIANLGRAFKYAGLSIRWAGYETQRSRRVP